jgi:xanthine dehydrogenase YagR molybdenum-binding subunit
VWGISLALLEETHIDPRYGRAVNNNFAEYHVPVNADIADRRFAAEYCRSEGQSGLGACGIGAICIIGASAAVANAVYHATGKRARDLPITLDKLLA